MISREYPLRGMARRVLVRPPAALVQHWVGELTEKGGLVRSTQGPLLEQLGASFWKGNGTSSRRWRSMPGHRCGFAMRAGRQ